MPIISEEPAEATRRTIWQALENSVELYGELDAIVYQETRVTYAQLRQQVDRLAAGLLASGIQPGDHVAIIFPAIPEWIYVHYALASIGAVIVPINFNYRADEVRWVLRQGDVAAIITLDSFRTIDFLELLHSVDPALKPGEVRSEQFPLIKRMFVLDSDAKRPGTSGRRTLPSHEPSPAERARLAEIRARQTADDACYILFTSGSTARPKPALLAHRTICGAGHYMARAVNVGKDDRVLQQWTTFHVGGIVPCIAMPHSVGAAICLLGAFEPGLVLEVAERERCTMTGGFDTNFTKIMDHPDFSTRDISSLKKCLAGCTPSYYDRLQAAFNFDLLVMTYGITEGGSAVAMVTPRDTDPEIRRSSNGRPHPGLEFRIIDPQTGRPVPAGTPGEIIFRGWAAFLGYYKMPEETAATIDADGFVHTGDFGWLDEQGYLYYRGRYKQMIKTGGENVSQREVEIFLEDNIPEVALAQVVGVPDETWGEAVVAFVQLRAGMRTTSDGIREACRGKIANFKIPKHVFLIDARDWPVLDVGRPDKHTLRQMAMERLGRLKIN
ncbi:MAG: hypothetical protein EPO21_00110 [Chloroflexota bacterium]|nr:MAG: hypothetical protein EPO21_00110 [Chloroflexota bacterium]